MGATGNSILIIHEKSKECKFLDRHFQEKKFRVHSTSNGYSGLEYLSFEHYDVILASASLPLMTIEDFLPRVRKNHPCTKIILIGDKKAINSALVDKYNVFDIIGEDISESEMKALLDQLTTALEVSSYKIIGSCAKMRNYFSLLEKIMKSSVTVLIYGESGTGKELTARAIHEGGPRSGKPFVTVNCATIPENLLESELFGHEKGAFTGALQKRIGKFEQAHQGSIFLDEIGELSPVIQAKFLRVLEEQSFERVGGNETVKVDVRIISATNRNLKEMVDNREFREDLFYRLNAIPIHVPPLRERKDDIPELVSHFLEKYLFKAGKTSPMKIAPETMESLKKYHWPGNVRELENIIMRSMVLSENLVIGTEDLPPEVLSTIQKTSGESFPAEGALRRVCSLEELEKEAIQKALIETNYNAAGAARLLNIGRMTFYRKAKIYSIRLR